MSILTYVIIIMLALFLGTAVALLIKSKDRNIPTKETSNNVDVQEEKGKVELQKPISELNQNKEEKMEQQDYDEVKELGQIESLQDLKIEVKDEESQSARNKLKKLKEKAEEVKEETEGKIEDIEKEIEVEIKDIEEDIKEINVEQVSQELKDKDTQTTPLEVLAEDDYTQKETIEEEQESKNIQIEVEESVEDISLDIEEQELAQEKVVEEVKPDKKATFVVVDDANFMRILMKKILEEGGYEVIGEASNGKEAIEVVKAVSPDVVTLDITMPDMDGIEALEKILIIKPDTKVIMCSAIDRRDMILKALKMGAKDFISKPFEQSKALETIKRVINM